MYNNCGDDVIGFDNLYSSFVLEVFVPSGEFIWGNFLFAWVTIEVRGVVRGFDLKEMKSLA